MEPIVSGIRILFGLSVLLCIGMAVLVAPVGAESRLALVIGNSDYRHTARLDNPANDARLITSALQQVGFTVQIHTDLEQKTLGRAVAAFARKVQASGPDTMALLYYAGHGLQVNGTNFLVPVDAKIEAEADVPLESVSANDVFHTLRIAGANVNIIVLDACRNNPFKAAARSMSRGLARMEAPAGSIISYAAAPGQVAADGDSANSPFSEALAKVILTPGLTVEQVFKQVRIAVHEKTGGAQLPTEESQLMREVFFAGQTEATVEPPKIADPIPAPAPTPEAADQADADIAFYKALELNTLEGYEAFLTRFPKHERADQVSRIVRSMSDEQMWLRIKKADTIAAYRRYLIAFPNGTYVSEAKAQITRLQRQASRQPAPDPLPLPDNTVPPQTGDCGAPHGSYRVSGVRSNDVLNIRAGPGSRYEIVGEIPPNGRGVGIERCKSNGNWCVVRYRCYRGWASTRYLTQSGGTQSGSYARLYRVIDHIPPDMLNVRSGPGTKHQITSRIPHDGINVEVGQCRKVSGYRHRWCVVTYQGERGWAYARYLAHMQTGARPR